MGREGAHGRAPASPDSISARLKSLLSPTRAWNIWKPLTKAFVVGWNYNLRRGKARVVWWNYWEVEEAAMSETNFQPLESNEKVIISRLLLNMKIYNIQPFS